MTLQEVQKVSLDILKDVHAFCESHNIRYSLAYGTLIGAIRHKGFVPWDDDIDIVMPRPDFERFCYEYQSGNGYKLYKPGDMGYFMVFARVCDNVDTQVKTIYPWSCEPTGVWIDILPLDGVPDDKEEFLEHVKRIRKVGKIVNRLRTGRFLKLKDTNSVKNLFLCIVKRILYSKYDIKEQLKKHMMLLNRYKYENASFCGQLTVMDYPEKEHNPKENFNYYIKMSFCGLDFCVMNGYDDILKRYYGDYMQLPPKEQQIVHPENSYYWK